MGDAGECDAAAYRKRDEPIKRLLLSSDEADRADGMLLLDQTFRKRVAGVLVPRARRGESTACSALLKPETGNLDPQVFEEVWRETVASVWENVKHEKFKSDGSLLAYLVTIAERRTIDQYRRRPRVDNSVKPESLATPGVDNVFGLLEEILQFCDALSEKDRAMLKLGVGLALANGSAHVSPGEFFAEYEIIRRDKGWSHQSEAAILRHYYRLRARLRRYLQERQYNV